MKLMPPAIEEYLIGHTSSPKIYRIDIASQHKVTDTRQIHWTTKMITPVGTTTMELLIAEETCGTVYPYSVHYLHLKLKRKLTRTGMTNKPTNIEGTFFTTKEIIGTTQLTSYQTPTFA